MFAIGFSNKTAYPYRLAIASFLPDVENHVLFLTHKKYYRFKSYKLMNKKVYKEKYLSLIITRLLNCYSFLMKYNIFYSKI
jgi:hypothetical protein